MSLTQAIYESLMEDKIKILEAEAKNPCPECGGKIIIKHRYNCAGQLRYFKHCLCADAWKRKEKE